VTGSTEQTGRLWEIDVARTVAIAMMVSYHVVYDIDMLAPGLWADPFTGAWGALPEATGSLFLLLVGMSLSVSDGRAEARGTPRRARARRHMMRALRVLGAAMVVTATTFLVFPERYVRFGILHAIAVSALLATPLLRLGRWNAVLGVGVVAAGIAMRGGQSEVPGSFIVGAPPAGFSSVDYWPLLPWFGVVLIGVAIGGALYPRGARSRLVRRVTGLAGRGNRVAVWLGTPGRRSLLVYLVHQPVLVLLVAAVLTATGTTISWSR
jgi:uncharacterized membrane protein